MLRKTIPVFNPALFFGHHVPLVERLALFERDQLLSCPTLFEEWKRNLGQNNSEMLTGQDGRLIL